MNLPVSPSGDFGVAEGAIFAVALLVLTAVSWTAFWLYERRAERRGQQQEEAKP